MLTGSDVVRRAFARRTDVRETDPTHFKRARGRARPRSARDAICAELLRARAADATMFSAKRKKPEAKAPIPQWKLDMMAAEASQSSATGASPSKAAADADADAAKRARVDADAGASSSAAPPPPPDDDDDDDDDVDLSAYQLEDDDDEEEGARAQAAGVAGVRRAHARGDAAAPRDARRRRPKSRKTFLVEDNENSIEKSAGSERSRIAWEMKASSRGRDAGSGPWQKHRR